MTCLKAASPPSALVSSEQPVSADLSNVSPVYNDLAEVFQKDRAQSLPPHRPYDCTIDLLPGTTLPTSCLYSLSLPEQEAMERYITESLAAGIIRASSSPVVAGFFFVEKKDKTLRPCIDHRGLNNITVKNKYPLPFLTSAFELLQGATIFSKLDLRNAYHSVRIRKGDEWKTAFNTHLGHFEYLVMPFGLTNAPAVFQALVNDVLRDFINRFVFVYLDNILIFSKTQAEHETQVRPATCTLGAISWEIEAAVREAQKTEPDPGGGPARRLFVPSRSGLKFFIGPIRLVSPATQEHTEPFSFCNVISGGPL